MLSRVVLCLILFFSFFGCQKSTSLPNCVKINLGGEPPTLDPRLARDPNSQILMRMLFEGLTRINPNEEPALALASGCEITEDLKTYTFTLRNVLWSNDQPVRSSDFAYAWKKILSPDFPSDNAFQLYIIKNAKLVKEGNLSPDQLGIYTPDDHTLILELEYPIPYLFELLAAPFFFPVHQETAETNPSWFQKVESYVSNGPFSLKQWRHNDSILALKNPFYWDAENVHIQGLYLTMVDADTEMKLYEKGQLHWAGSPLSQIPVDSIKHLSKELIVKPRDETAFLRTNIQVKALSHPKIRKALALSINRKDIVDYVTQGGQFPALCFLPPSMKLQEEPYFEDNDIEKACEFFAEGLRALGIEKESFPTITLTYLNKERSHLIAQTLQQQWFKALGIHIHLEATERKIYFDRISHGDYQMALSSWGGDFHDPINFLEVFKYRSQSTNNTNWEDSEYIQDLNESYHTLDPEKRKALLTRCESILMDAMPIIPLFYYMMLYRKVDNLEGVFLSSLGNLDFKWARLENENR